MAEAETAQEFFEQRQGDWPPRSADAAMYTRGRAVSVVSDEDRQDIRQSLVGDEEAYARIIGRYQPKIAAQMWRFSRDAAVVEELVQEAFVEAYLSLGKFKGRAPLLHWLRKIATRVGYRYWRKRTREQGRREALARRADELVPPQGTSPSEAGEYLHTLLAQLPVEDRLVLTLHYFEARDTREIAERMGWTRSLVKVRAHRARKKLKTLLEEAGYGRQKPS
ncbi:MAG: RNA polymerase sigma factor [Candidatus Hydrogenedentes bacterium]|nr:RNA polymerase sigma factor [Candidatus Hydrogenedentota bacterium]